jgi:hypothetical protein
MGPQNRLDGQHCDAMIKIIRALLDNLQDTTHRVTMKNSRREILRDVSCKKIYISDEPLHAMELWIDQGIKVQVEGSEGERLSQIWRCTGSHSRCGGARRNDWIWVSQCPGRC